MLQNRNKGSINAPPPKPKKSAEPTRTPGKKKKSVGTSSQKPSIFASAVATRNNNAAKSKGDNASAAAVYNSASSAATANFGKATHDGGNTTTGYATNQSVTSSAAMNAGIGQQTAHKGIKPYQASRRKREERKRAPTADELDIDKNISMFSSTAKTKATNDV